MNGANEVVILIGAPGSGKGTMAQKATQAGFFVLSASDIIRRQRKSGVNDMISAGKMIPDDIAVKIFTETLDYTPPCKDLMLDGLIRTHIQYKRLIPVLKKMGFGEIHTIFFDLTLKEAKKRMVERGRPDDTEAIIESRMSQYILLTLPIIALLKRHTVFHCLDCAGPREEVIGAFMEILGKMSRITPVS